MSNQILEQLTQVLESRKQAGSDDSYVASLYAAGLDKILEKVGEEATEVVIAGKNLGERQDAHATAALTGEVADLWFHSLVLLSHFDLSAQDVLEVLASRFGVGGHVEKANR